MSTDEGVQFPTLPSGKRSTLAAGAATLAAAARPIDSSLADRIAADATTGKFRQSYSQHACSLAAACAKDTQSALDAAEAGLANVYETFEYVRTGQVLTLEQAMASPLAPLHTGSVSGNGSLASELKVIYNGKELSGAALAAQARAWEAYGCLEGGAARAIGLAATTKEWLDLRNRCFVLLGGSSALSPLSLLLQCGATVIAIGRRKPAVWAKLISQAKSSAGTLVFPCADPLAGGESDAQLADKAGADLLTQAPEIGAWLQQAVPSVGLPTTVGMYTYLDSDAHVRVSLACDMVTRPLLALSGVTISLAYLQTPSIPYIIGEEIHSAEQTRHATSWLRTLGYPANATAAVPTAAGEPTRYVHDGVLLLQGPNYLLAKTIQQWRAMLARCRQGLAVSANVAPPARTASVLDGNKNASSIAKAYAGMGHTPPMVAFDADTVTGCMGALLIHDVCNPNSIAQPATPLGHPSELFTVQAFHGGSFRLGAKPTSLGKLWFILGSLVTADPRPQADGGLVDDKV
jgi:hypothetical protein